RRTEAAAPASARPGTSCAPSPGSASSPTTVVRPRRSPFAGVAPRSATLAPAPRGGTSAATSAIPTRTPARSSAERPGRRLPALPRGGDRAFGAGREAGGLDPPALAGRHEVGARALERHAAGVVADRADRGHLVVRQQRLRGQRSELGALVLDRPSSGPRLLDQGRDHELDRL